MAGQYYLKSRRTRILSNPQQNNPSIKNNPNGSFLKVADPTRLELATSAVTGQRSNQLSYESTCIYYSALFPIMQE